MLDLFCGRWGWSKAFAARGWECVGIDWITPESKPEGCIFLQWDISFLTTASILDYKPDFICASPPCEEFSVFGMKHFHPNPPYPTFGSQLFNHTRRICEESGLPHVIENVRAAQQFVGKAAHHCGPFYLWGNAVPPLVVQGISKTKWTMNKLMGRDKPGNQCPELFMDKKERARRLATIPPELANCVADYAERLLEQEV